MNCRLGSFTQDDNGVTACFFDRNTIAKALNIDRHTAAKYTQLRA